MGLAYFLFTVTACSETMSTDLERLQSMLRPTESVNASHTGFVIEHRPLQMINFSHPGRNYASKPADSDDQVFETYSAVVALVTHKDHPALNTDPLYR